MRACVRACVRACERACVRAGRQAGGGGLELDLLEPAVQLQLLVLRNLLEPIVRARRREVRGRLEVFLQSHSAAPVDLSGRSTVVCR